MDANRLLGLADLRLSGPSSAETPLTDAAQWSARNLSPGSWRRARAWSAWGEYLADVGRFDEAEPILLESHRVLETELGRQATATVDATRRLARLYLAWGKPGHAARFQNGTAERVQN